MTEAARSTGFGLVVVGGLPATGKTTVSRLLASQIGAAYLRVDAVEQALRDSGELSNGVVESGYRAIYALARENLLLGLTVVAECVNPLSLSREAWQRTARSCGVDCLQVELICSDENEHRRRVETRRSDIEGLSLPDWQKILDRDYEPWQPSLRIDTAHATAESSALQIEAALAQRP